MPQTLATMGGRYILQQKIGEGGMGAVYRATDRLTQDTVALKQVTVPRENLQFGSQILMSKSEDFRLALAQEFKTLASLRHPNIISVLDYGFDEQRQPYLTMELLENAPNLIEAGRELARPQQIELVVQVLQALTYLHRRNVIHRDLKPSNVLVIEGQVKVLDFGLAVAREHPTEHDQSIYGTPAYMAPEMLDGQPASEASDLYSVGLMTYELFAGRHPYNTANVAALTMDILRTVPDTRSLGLDEQLVEILDRLLAKSPVERYTDARELINIYAEATHQPELVVESRAVRESYLQAARFVGRKAEFGQLIEALQTASAGQGSAWLVGGESGVGKSRLLDEFRTHALVEGALVLQGQAVSYGAALYEVWRESLRWLCLETELYDLQASVLKALVPDIATLLERAVPDAPKLDPQGSRDRLLRTIVNLFQKQSRPIVVVLEDIHWASKDSLAVLKRLTQSIDQQSLLIVASYRDDEQPALPEVVPAMSVLKLPRLSADDVAALSESMLGAAGRDPEVLNLLQKETEGNTFFIIEVVRALAEEAGQLAQIDLMSLPSTVSTGGMQMVLRRRLERVPEQARALLQVAAISGRDLDLNLLRAIETELSLGAWLNRGANAAVLEVQDGRWRFAHDKLREELLANVPPDRYKTLNQQVAEAIEQVYAGADDSVPALAYHWREAGVFTKAIDYLEQAGQTALRDGANQDAVNYFSQALILDEGLAGRRDRLRRAQWQRRLGEAYLGMGQLAESRECLYEALAQMGRPIPVANGRIIISLAGQLLRQALHRLWSARFLGRAQRDENLLGAATAYRHLAEIFYFADETILIIYAGLQTLNLAERVKSAAELAQAYASMCIVAGFASLHALAEAYSQRAWDTAQRTTHLQSRGVALLYTSVYYLGVGRWSKIEERLEQAIEIFDSLGDRHNWGICMAILAFKTYHRGEFAQGARLWDQVQSVAGRSSDAQQIAWGLEGQGENLLRLGQIEQATNLLDNALTLLAKNSDRITEIQAYGTLALLHLRQDQSQLARQAAEKATRLISQAAPSSVATYEGYSGVTEVYLALWAAGLAKGQSAPEIKALEKSARQACKAMRGFARAFPIGQPRAWFYQGLYESIAGRSAKAHKAWHKSLAHARRLEMPYEEGLAHAAIGQHLPDNTSPQQEHLACAREIFTRLEAAYDLTRIQEEGK